MTTTTNVTKKMTKAMWFEAIKAMVQSGKAIDDVDGCVAFCEHEIELLKNKSESKKPTKTQAEAEKLMETVTKILKDHIPVHLKKLAKDMAYLRLFEDAISAPAAILYDRKFLLPYNGNGILPTPYVILK